MKKDISKYGFVFLLTRDTWNEWLTFDYFPDDIEMRESGLGQESSICNKGDEAVLL